MSSIVEALRQWGCDTQCIQTRFLGDDEFYLKLLSMTAEDDGYARLLDAVARKDAKVAFESAHALKGMYGNMGLTPLYTLACELSDLYRDGTFREPGQAIETMGTQIDGLRAILAGKSAN